MSAQTPNMPAIATPPRARVRDGRAATWVAIGLAAGAIPAVALLAGLPMRYVVYGTLGVLVAAALPYLAGAAGSTTRLVWILFILSLQLEIAYAPVTWSFRKPAGPYGILISPTLLAGGVLAAGWLLRRYAYATQRIDPAFWWASLAFLASGVPSVLLAPDRSLAAYGLFEIASLVLTGAVTMLYCAAPQGMDTMRAALFAIVVTQSLLIVVEQVVGVQFSLAHGVTAGYGWGSNAHGRFAGSFGAPSVVGTFLVVGLLFAFGRLFSKRTPARRGLFAWMCGLGMLALLLTRTRSAWVAFGIGAAGLGWQWFRWRTLSSQLAMRLVAVGVLALLLAWPLVSQRLGEDHSDAANIRGNLVRIAAAMIASHPLLGVGLNNATNQVYNYVAAAGVEGWVFIVHNQFLLTACETGIPGLLAFLLVFFVGLRAAYRAWGAVDVAIRETGAVLFWSLISMAWALNLDHVSGAKTYFLLWVLIGAACGLQHQAATEQRA